LRQAGKTLSRWTTKIGETTIGGQPPTFDDIDTDPDTLKKFADVIFEDDTDKRWHPKVRELLVMTLLLRYDQFVDVLMSHPFAKLVEGIFDDTPQDRFTCSAVRDNLFISRVDQALEKTCGQDRDSMFRSWISEARKAFLSRNAPGLPIETFPLYGGDGKGFMMDTRCFTDHFNALASTAQANHMELQQQRHTLNDIRNALTTESKITNSFIVERLFNIEKSVRRLETHMIGEAAKPSPVPSKGIIRFSISSKSLPKYASLADVTTAFFVDDYRAGYAFDTKSQSWNELDSQGKKSLRNKFATIKRAVRMVLLHADCYPVVDENHPSQYKDVIKGIVTPAEKRLREALGFDDDKTLSIYKLEKELKQPAAKELGKSLKLPDNTPDDARKFFNSSLGLILVNQILYRLDPEPSSIFRI